MNRLETVKKITTVLLIISILVLIIFVLFYRGGAALISAAFYGWNISEEYILPAVITLIAIVQCINLSIALCIIRVLDKHYMPLY